MTIGGGGGVCISSPSKSTRALAFGQSMHAVIGFTTVHCLTHPFLFAEQLLVGMLFPYTYSFLCLFYSSLVRMWPSRRLISDQVRTALAVHTFPSITCPHLSLDHHGKKKKVHPWATNPIDRRSNIRMQHPPYRSVESHCINLHIMITQSL